MHYADKHHSLAWNTHNRDSFKFLTISVEEKMSNMEGILSFFTYKIDVCHSTRLLLQLISGLVR